MARPDFSEVTQEEVEKLFNQDSPLEDEPEADEEDSGEEDSGDEEENQEEETPDPEEETEGEEAESEESDEDEEEEEEPGNQWQERAERAERSSRNLQSELTKRSNSLKEIERSLPQLRAKADALDRWNSLFGKYPQLQQVIEREVQRLENPMSGIEIPKGMENDPAIQFFQKSMETMMQQNRSLQAELRETRAKVGKVDEWENKSKEAEDKAKLDGLLDEAKAEIKSMFGRDATEQDLTEVLKYMVQKNYYDSGATAAFHVFRDQYRKLSTRASSENIRRKAGKFPARTKGVNPGRVSNRPKEAGSPEEAIAMALADQGAGI